MGQENGELNEFSKIIKDLLNDLVTSFPELAIQFNHDLKNIHENPSENQDESLKNVYEYCKTVYPERFFDILYQKDEIFTDASINTHFLPNIDFADIWKDDVSVASKAILWKYMQLILFSIVTNVKSGDSFGNTAKLFEAIGETEFKEKLEDTIKQMQNAFINLDSDFSNCNVDRDTSGINFNNLPKPDEIHEHLNSIMNGKLGNLAKEIAEDTAKSFNLDGGDINSVSDVFQSLFRDPTKLMSIVKNVGSKLDEKMKSGDIKESELLAEATEMMSKMKNMPGMGNIGDILSKMGLPNMNGGKMNNNAFENMMNINMKKAKAKERMRSKLAGRTQQENSTTTPVSPKKNELEAINANLQDLLKNMGQGKDSPDISRLLNSLNLPTARETGNPKKKNKNKKK